jgi:hypothetical protein
MDFTGIQSHTVLQTKQTLGKIEACGAAAATLEANHERVT